MLIDQAALIELRDGILFNEDAPYTSGVYLELWTDIHIANAIGTAPLGPLKGELAKVLNRQRDLLTLVSKLEWMRQLRDGGKLDPMIWFHYARSDVDSFFTTTRSLFDHLAVAVGLTAAKRGVSPTSFNRLRAWIARSPDANGANLGSKTAELIASADWFDELRALRDGLVHDGDESLVFPGGPGIQVQLYAGARKRINDPSLLLGENTASFERIAAATASRIWVLLERLADDIRQRLQITPSGGGPAMSVHSGLGVLRGWIEDTLASEPLAGT